MIKRGTKNVGIKLNGNWLIGRVVISSASIPKGVGELRIPNVTAVTRSRIPRAFHTITVRFRRGVVDNNTKATRGAVAPMATSPHPAGSAKDPGRMSRA